jgi:NAD(P)-dependent dehydrogenase (short-subunit alcohol dehydrogenase family)
MPVLPFQDKVIVVIGAAGGIGASLCRLLAAEGARLMLGGRDAGRLQALADELDSSETTASAVDATDSTAVQQFFAAAKSRHGQIDGVVNCAGSILLKPAHQTSDAEWLSTVATNLHTAFYTLRHAIGAMSAGGSIVLVSTAAARIGLANHEAVAASKAGVIGLTLSAAATYAPRKIRVNCVAPGLVETPLSERITRNETSRNASLAMHALGRLGQPEDVAAAIAFLLNPSNSWITGQVLGVDGGLGSLRSR